MHCLMHNTAMMDQCWASVVDAGPALSQHWVNIHGILWETVERVLLKSVS